MSAPGRRIAVTGSSGLVGSSLVRALRREGHEVLRVVRRPPAAGEAAVRWDPEAGSLDAAGLEAVDAVVHLAGENIAGGRWTAARKRRIVDSRVRGTQLVAGTLARLARRPAVLVSASAVGYYGNRADQPLDESSAPGTGFLAETCRAWEAATAPAEQAGIRVVHLRIGVVLNARGGMLARVLLPFRLGLGGRVGDGRQYLSWIAHAELIRVVRHVLLATDVAGAVNAVAPQPVTNAEFTRTLGRVLRRPTPLPVPAFAIRLILGQLGQELLLDGARVLPRRLTESGYRFRWDSLGDALRAELGR